MVPDGQFLEELANRAAAIEIIDAHQHRGSWRPTGTSSMDDDIAEDMELRCAFLDKAGVDGCALMAAYVVPAVQAAGAKVQYVGNSGTQVNFNYMKNARVETGSVATYSDADGAWVYVDEALRAMLGAAPAKAWNLLASIVVTAHNYAATKPFWSGLSTPLVDGLKKA